jgi:signal transduction histidine kinase
MNFFKAKEEKNKLRFFVSHNFPRKLLGDEQRINQILINLIANAIKFTHEGEICVSIGFKYERA